MNQYPPDSAYQPPGIGKLLTESCQGGQSKCFSRWRLLYEIGCNRLQNSKPQIRTIRIVLFSCFLAFVCPSSKAQDKPYFVTYSDDMEEHGEMEFETKTALARPDGGNPFAALATEYEYGVRSWWTAGVYLDTQATDEDSALVTGFRLESRFRPIRQDHIFNPILYVEYENISDADKAMLEVVGHDGEADLAGPNREARRAHRHEGELKLILSSNLKSWNISENFIAEKNLGDAPWEFGYSAGATRQISSDSSGKSCTFCWERISAGAEIYGGLGNTATLSLGHTSHYLSPLLGWQLGRGVMISFAPGFGLTRVAMDRVYRVGFAWEFVPRGISLRK